MIEVKKLNIEPEKKGLKEFLKGKQTRRTLIGIAIGSIAGLGFFYFSEGQYLNEIIFQDIIKSMGLGGFFGFFVTNSPCARGHC